MPGVFVAAGGEEAPPRHCHECGAAYPWIQAKLEAAQELVDMIEELDKTDREALKKSLEEITRETAKSEVAAQKVKLFAKKAGKEGGKVIYKVSLDVASSLARVVLLGG